MIRIDRRTAIAAAASGLMPDMAYAQTTGSFVGPLPGWRNVRTDFGAVGDGRADDTAALQRALDAVAAGSGSLALYLPAGRYRISRTLVLARKTSGEGKGISIQGEDPATTALVWDGPRGGTMLTYGAWYSRLGRLTFDGRDRAGIGLAHGPDFVTANEIADCVFADVDVGIEAGTMDKAGIAETSVVRCQFLRCSTAGASLRNFNSLDWWFWDCRFEACRLGVTNIAGAGNFYVYNSAFLRSTEADISIHNTGYFSFRNNASQGSKAFFVAQFTTAAAETTLQGNRIIETTDVAAIRVANAGPLILLDNLVVSRAGQAGPAVEARSAIGVAIGNRFTVADPLALKAGSTMLDNSRVPRPPNSPPPPAPRAPPRYRGPVTSIAAGTPTRSIQAAIDALAARGGGVIHFAPGVHPIDRTLTAPANVFIRLIGDGIVNTCRLEWTGAGAGPVLRLSAPSRVQVENLVVFGAGRADGLAMAGLDGVGTPLLLDQVRTGGCTEAGFHFERLVRTGVFLRDTDHNNCRVGMRLVGARAPVTILSGSSSDNEVCYVLTDGSRLLARDIWYETATKPGFLQLSGEAEFVLNGANVATPRRAEAPPVMIDRLRGRALFLGVIFTGAPETLPAVVASGNEPLQALLLLGCQGNGEFFADRSSNGRAARLNGLTYTPGGGAKPINDRGPSDPGFIRQMLSLARMKEPRDLGSPRLIRVYLDRCRVGLRVSA